jgi:hypothetical protein
MPEPGTIKTIIETLLKRKQTDKITFKWVGPTELPNPAAARKD